MPFKAMKLLKEEMSIVQEDINMKELKEIAITRLNSDKSLLLIKLH